MSTSRVRFTLAALAAAGLACSLLPPNPATPTLVPTSPPAPYADYGDARDPSHPSLFASNGARAIDVDQFWLGSLDQPSVTREEDAMVVDRDELDDGLERVVIRGGAASLAFLAVKSSAASDGVAFFNLLADLDGSGEWQGADEWVVVNRPVALPPGGSELIEVEIPLQTFKEWWIRAALTDAPVDAAQFPEGWDGTGEFALGEIEDYRFGGSGEPPPTEPPITETPWATPTVTPTPKFITSEAPTLTPSPTPRVVVTGDFVPVCNPNPATIQHGQSVGVRLELLGGDSVPDRFIARHASAGVAPDRVDLSPFPEGDEGGWSPWGEGAGFTFTSRDVDGPDRVEEFVIAVTLQNRSTSRFIECRIQVEHKAGDRRIIDGTGDGFDFADGRPTDLDVHTEIVALDLRATSPGVLEATFTLAGPPPDPASLGEQRLTYKIGIQVPGQKGGYGQGMTAVEGSPPTDPPMRWHYAAAVDCTATGCRGVLFQSNNRGQFFAAGELEFRIEANRVTVLVPVEKLGRPADFNWVGIAVTAGGRPDLPTDRVPNSGSGTYAGP